MATDDDTPGIGHNAPPVDIAALDQAGLIEWLRAQHTAFFTHAADLLATLYTRRDQLVAASGRAPEIVDEETAQKITDFAAQLAAYLKEAEAQRVTLKAPILAADRALQGMFELLTKDASAAQTKALRQLTAWQAQLRAAEQRRRDEEARQAAERARIAREEAAEREREAARQRAAAAAAEAAGKAAEAARLRAASAAAEEAALEQSDKAVAEEEALVVAEKQAAAPITTSAPLRTRTDTGALSSSRGTWKATLVDPKAIDLEALRPYITADAIQKALNQWMKANKPGKDQPAPEFAGATIAFDRNAFVAG